MNLIQIRAAYTAAVEANAPLALLTAARLSHIHQMPLAVAECIVQRRAVSWVHLSDGSLLDHPVTSI